MTSEAIARTLATLAGVKLEGANPVDGLEDSTTREIFGVADSGGAPLVLEETDEADLIIANGRHLYVRLLLLDGFVKHSRILATRGWEACDYVMCDEGDSHLALVELTRSQAEYVKDDPTTGRIGKETKARQQLAVTAYRLVTSQLWPQLKSYKKRSAVFGVRLSDIPADDKAHSTLRQMRRSPSGSRGYSDKNAIPHFTLHKVVYPERFAF